MKRRTNYVAFCCLVLLILGVSAPRPVDATTVSSLQLDVTYTDGSIMSGPLSFGLSALPTSVDATFMLGPGTLTPGIVPIYNWGIADVMSAAIVFGDASWTTSDLASFSMQTVLGVINSLTYEFNPTTSLTVDGPVILNFPLTITGTDIASGRSFEYVYDSSTQTLTPIPEPATLTLFAVGLAGLGFVTRRRRREAVA